MSGVFSVMPVLNGQLPAGQGVLYTSPGVSTYFKKFALYSESGSLETIQLWLQPNGGTPYLWRQLKLTLNQAADVLEGGESLTLSSGDSLLGACSFGPVDYTLTGVLEA